MSITYPCWVSFTRTNPVQFESLDYYRDGFCSLSLVLTSRGSQIYLYKNGAGIGKRNYSAVASQDVATEPFALDRWVSG